MVQFRKSKKFGPVRLTLSNRGLSTSFGAGPFRLSRGADGKVRRTVRAPGVGLYDTKVLGQTAKHRTAGTTATATHYVGTEEHPALVPKPGLNQRDTQPPNSNRGLMIGGGVVGAIALLIGLGNLSSCGRNDVSSTPMTVTKTVTVSAAPTTVTETVTQAAAPAPFLEPPAEVAPPVVEAPPPVAEQPAELPPPEVTPWVPLVPPAGDLPQAPSSAYYSSCSAARAAGAAPLYRGDAGYRPGLDRDDDGVACE